MLFRSNGDFENLENVCTVPELPPVILLDTCHILSTCRKQMIPFRERILKISGFLQKLLDMTGEFGYNKSVGEFCKKFPKKSMQ